MTKKKEEKVVNNNYNFEMFSFNKFLKGLAIFFLVLIALQGFLGLTNDLTESDYDKCLDVCEGSISKLKAECVSSCNEIKLYEKIDSLDSLIKIITEKDL